jgi:hypothetical protein
MFLFVGKMEETTIYFNFFDGSTNRAGRTAFFFAILLQPA